MKTITIKSFPNSRFIVASSFLVMVFALSPLWLSGLGAQSTQPQQPPPNTPYWNDTQSSWVDDFIAEPLSLPSQLLCLLAEAKASDMTNQGQYLALVDGNKCFGIDAENDSPQGGASSDVLWPMSVISERASSTSPQIIKGHLKVKPQEMLDAVASFHVTVSEAASAFNPNGVMEFSLSFKAIDESVRLTFKADADGVALVAKENAPDIYNGSSADVTINGYFSTSSQTAGLGFIKYTSNNEDSLIPADLLNTWVYGYDENRFCRYQANPTTFTSINVGQELCFSRLIKDSWQSAWSYRLYNANGTVFNPLKPGESNSFDIFINNQRAWISSFGLWMPNNQTNSIEDLTVGVKDAKGNDYILVKLAGVFHQKLSDGSTKWIRPGDSDEIKLTCDSSKGPGCMTSKSIATLSNPDVTSQPFEQSKPVYRYTLKTGLDFGLYYFDEDTNQEEKIGWPIDFKIDNERDDFYHGTGPMFLTDEDGNEYDFSIGQNSWNQTFGLYDTSSKAFVKFASSINVTYKIDPGFVNNGNYLPFQEVSLQVNGKNISIPGFCFDKFTNIEIKQDECKSGISGYSQDYLIPFGPSGYVIYEDEGQSRILWVKWEERDIVFQPISDKFADLGLIGVTDQIKEFVERVNGLKLKDTNDINSSEYSGLFPEAPFWEQTPKVVQGIIQ